MFTTSSGLTPAYRPALWGFFISLPLLGLLQLLQVWKQRSLVDTWPDREREEVAVLTSEIQASFSLRAAKAIEQAGIVSTNGFLFESIREGGSENVASAFAQLEEARNENIASLEITDAQGTILVWSGRGSLPSYKSLLQNEASDSFFVITSVGLHRYLTFIQAMQDRQFYVVVNQTLEMNYPISNRFISRFSLSEELSQVVGREVRIAFDSSDVHPGEGWGTVPIRTPDGKTLTSVHFRFPHLEEAVLEVQYAFGVWKAGLIAVISVLGFIALIQFPRLRGLRYGHTALVIVAIWGIRILWRYVEFPSVLLGGWLFDPTLFASPFLFDLTSSVGELTLSVVCLFMTVAVLARRTIVRLVTGNQERPSTAPLPVAGIVFWILVLPIIVRSFGAAVRGFVFDSTLYYQDPASLLPSVPVLLMIGNLFFLTMALVGITMVAFVQVKETVSRFTAGWSSRSLHLITTGLFVAGYLTFSAVDREPQVPVSVLVLLLVVGTSTDIIRRKEIHPQSSHQRALRLVGVAAIVAFLIAAVVMDAKVHEKERQRLQSYAQELLRPVDSWISLVVSDAINTAQEQLRAVSLSALQLSATDPAFNVWAQTLLSREGYNSGLFLYDEFGRERSSFFVGLTSYERYELLTRIFDEEEEELVVFDRTVRGEQVKYYGMWSTVREEGGRSVGTIAVGLSASRRALFRGDSGEFLRTSATHPIDPRIRKMTVDEFDRGILVSSTSPNARRGDLLPSTIAERLKSEPARFLWTEQVEGATSAEVLYARDPSAPERIIRLTLTSLDVRWHLFNLMKLLISFGLLGVILFVVSAGWLVMKGNRVNLGFRGKLAIAFAVLSILPLIFLAYYNRQLAIDRLNESIERRLGQELELVHQRVVSALQSEEDFASGVNDDFCEAVASDLGIDFTVYNRRTVQASSRPELYRASLLDSRLGGSAYTETVLRQRGFFQQTERIGEVDYVVGYSPIMLEGRFLGVVAVPALYRLHEIDQELAQRNAYLLGAYAFVVAITTVIAFVLAGRLSRPLRELSQAARRIGRGDLDLQLTPRSSDEVGELVKAFNEMVQELKANREHLARVERELAWKEMAKQVAHEIKNPLTPIKLSIQHLQQAYKDNVPQFKEILDRVARTVVDQIETLSRIATEFSNFARMPMPRYERISLNEILRESVTLFSQVEGIAFKTKFDETLVPIVADRDELRRVFINILRNSVQAMPKGGTVEMSTRLEDGSCVITLRDNGPGIPEDIRSRVFQPNFSTKTDGMGIGLAISRKVIEDLNGTIELWSKVGEGTTIEIRLPMSHPATV
jgi:signal transduction histidine kinase